MEEKNIKTIQTTRGELRYYRDWKNTEGGVVMLNPQTINRYREIKDQHADCDACGVFFAFSDEQFKEGYNKLVKLGYIKDGDTVQRTNYGGMFGTKEGLDKYFAYYDGREERIAAECDPQEIYFYEYNNHESMYAWDGDKEAFMLCVSIFGEEIAKTIKRL